jgi:hypothetical protein
MSDMALKTGAAVSEQELLDYLDTFGSTGALLPTEKSQFLNMAKAYGLNPFKREIYAVVYCEGKYRKCSIITGYEVYLKRAERTGLLDGWEVTFTGAGGSLSCRITIWRKDWGGRFLTRSIIARRYKALKKVSRTLFGRRCPEPCCGKWP